MATSMKQMIQNMAKEQVPSIYIGVVSSTDPLTITLQNDLNVSLSAVSLVIPSRIGDLEQGERLYLLSINRNRSYYVLDRE